MAKQQLTTMSQPVAEHYARLFGLGPERMKRFDDLSKPQQDRVNYYFGLINAGNFVYATKADGGIVSKREKRNEFVERIK